jgi:hypothetical protein
MAPTHGVIIHTMPRARSLSRFAKAVVFLEVFLGVGALGGGGALMLGSRGETIPLPVSALKGSPFETYFVPGMILFCALGLGPSAGAHCGAGRRCHAADLDGGRDRHRWLQQQAAAAAVLHSPRSCDHRRWAELADYARTIGAAR